MSILKCTLNYDLFETHIFNREVMKRKIGYRALIESMKKYGFLDSKPIMVVRNHTKKLKIKAGHHRFLAAQELGIPVKYIIEAHKDISIHELEKSTTIWSMQDYLVSFVRAGRHPYIIVKQYCGRTGIGISNAISLLGGQSAGSGNFREEFKRGTYELGDTTHANMVANIVLHCKKCKIPFAMHSSFVAAISKISQVDGFDPSLLKHKIKTFPYLLEKQPSLTTYVEMLETVYNRQNKSKIPLSFLANESAKKRKESGLQAKRK